MASCRRWWQVVWHEVADFCEPSMAWTDWCAVGLVVTIVSLFLWTTFFKAQPAQSRGTGSAGGRVMLHDDCVWSNYRRASPFALVLREYVDGADAIFVEAAGDCVHHRPQHWHAVSQYEDEWRLFLLSQRHLHRLLEDGHVRVAPGFVLGGCECLVLLPFHGSPGECAS